VSSQNWSTDGTLYNRDAGVIIYDASAAQYFQQIFLHDWEHLARRQARSD
jgi:phosphatidylserine/phosphatidylglycerophosphate/cardiolipin synthase-like enzyme